MKRNYVIFAILLAISSCNISDISNENSESIDTSHSFSNDESSIISSESINNEDVYFLKEPVRLMYAQIDWTEYYPLSLNA